MTVGAPYCCGVLHKRGLCTNKSWMTAEDAIICLSLPMLLFLHMFSSKYWAKAQLDRRYLNAIFSLNSEMSWCLQVFLHNMACNEWICPRLLFTFSLSSIVVCVSKKRRRFSGARSAKLGVTGSKAEGFLGSTCSSGPTQRPWAAVTGWDAWPRRAANQAIEILHVWM